MFKPDMLGAASMSGNGRSTRPCNACMVKTAPASANTPATTRKEIVPRLSKRVGFTSLLPFLGALCTQPAQMLR